MFNSNREDTLDLIRKQSTDLARILEISEALKKDIDLLNNKVWHGNESLVNQVGDLQHRVSKIETEADNAKKLQHAIAIALVTTMLTIISPIVVEVFNAMNKPSKPRPSLQYQALPQKVLTD